MAFFDIFRKPRIGGTIKAIGLDKWYMNLTENQRFKVIEYSGRGNALVEGEIYTDQSQKHFFWGVALNANHRRDFSFGIWLALEGLKADGSMSDQHFLYSAIIEAYDRMNDPANMAKYCWEEVENFRQIRPILEKDFHGSIPPSIPCRDKLIDLAISKGDSVEEFEALFSALVKNNLLSQDAADGNLEDLKSEYLLEQAEELLEKGDFENAKQIFDSLIAKTPADAPEIYKTIGNHFFDKQSYPQAMEYFQKAIKEDPLITGVRSKIQKIAKSLAIEMTKDSSETLSALHRKASSAAEWWEKRDVANECVKFGEYNLASNLYRESLNLRLQSGSPADTIYSHMAKMHEKLKDYHEAILCYLFSFRELSRSGLGDPPKFVSQGIERGLKKLKVNAANAAELYSFAVSAQNPDDLRLKVMRILSQD